MEQADLVAILEEPLRVSAAILKGDVDEAERLMSAHMGSAGNRTLRALSHKSSTLAKPKIKAVS